MSGRREVLKAISCMAAISIELPEGNVISLGDVVFLMGLEPGGKRL
jgi:hypothetical protein